MIELTIEIRWDDLFFSLERSINDIGNINFTISLLFSLVNVIFDSYHRVVYFDKKDKEDWYSCNGQ